MNGGGSASKPIPEITSRQAKYCNTFGALLLIAGLIIVACAGLRSLESLGPCLDFTGQRIVRVSTGLSLPVPIVQLCTHATSLFVIFYTGYLVSLTGMLLLLLGTLQMRFLVLLALIAGFIAMSLPFVFTADPYAYAFYAYEMFVQHASPYTPHQLSPSGAILRPLITLFPNASIGERIANYGPAFVTIYGVLVGPFAHHSLKAMIIAERALGAFSLWALALILSFAQPTAQGRRLAFICTALNPLFLFESVSFAHGDVVMMAVLAGAYVAYLSGRFSLSVVLCVLATEMRAVAAVAIVILFVDLSRRHGARSMVAPLFAGALTLAVTILASQVFFGAFTLGNAPTLATGAPVIILFEAFKMKSFPIAVALQAALGIFFLYIALRRGSFRYAPVAVLMSLPVIRAWYIQWLAPVAVVTRDRPLQAATLTAVALAPLAELPELTARGDLVTWTAVVLLQWCIPTAIYLWFRKRLPLAGQGNTLLPGANSAKPLF